MLRFFELLKRNCLKQGRKLNLADMGFGDNSLKVVAKIIKNNEFFSVLVIFKFYFNVLQDLRKNFVSGSGLTTLAQALL